MNTAENEQDPLFVTYRGLRALCVAYVLDEAQVVLLSLAGSGMLNNGLWAALVSHETLAISEHPSLCVRRLPAADHEVGVKTLARRKTASDYKTLRRRLPASGRQQLLLVHRQATGECAMDRDFYVLAEGLEGPLERFCAQFTQAVACAARPAWRDYLWQRGLDEQLIVPCASYGLRAWRVSAQAEAWQEIVKTGMMAHAID
jgi:hypothetical protein